ncbi:hypothetical protein [Sinorhizobium medicae]|uniref:hypothetical protein n=1 Tax=Sinorhizobium medicae TaxID=110321 RepID=UPI001873F474|nr:hypothetical protein [Sinorhizobium medicae]
MLFETPAALHGGAGDTSTNTRQILTSWNVFVGEAMFEPTASKWGGLCGKQDTQTERSVPAKGARKEPEPSEDKAVVDPHPGSVSDGTHPEASEGKR